MCIFAQNNNFTTKMITKFSVTNFKNFNQKFELDLQNTNSYNFNKQCVKQGTVCNGIIYGKNGIGKSNLGLAIFDIIGHLTEKHTDNIEYKFYLNASNPSKYATFNYEFIINSTKVIYEYKKTDNRTVIYEDLIINNKRCAFINREVSNLAEINFKGAESLNNEINNTNLSLLKYIKNNSVLNEDDLYNDVFLSLFKFVEGMLFFRSLQQNMYLGLEIGSRDIQEDIIERNNLKDLELFLNKAGVNCKLSVIKEADKNAIAFDFDNKQISFYYIASQGTTALVLFYFWLQRIKEKNKVSFLIIDEFDAFYHHELSRLIVEELQKTGVQFILTTHNTSIMTNDLLRPDCYFIMKEKDIKPLSKSTQKELREAHNLEKMYKAGSFNV